jgi:FkbM family methyltransferase
MLDGGAAHGLHTVNFAHFGGPTSRVIAVEANPDLIPGLEQLREKNNWRHVEIINVALADAPGRREFYVAPNVGHSSLMNHPHIAQVARKIEVEARTIDSIIDGGRLSFVKLDLEGGEYHAVLGARETIARERPIFVMECAYGALLPRIGISSAEYFGFWQSFGYELIDLSGIPLTEEMFNTPGLQGILANYLFAIPAGSADGLVMKSHIETSLAKATERYPEK